MAKKAKKPASESERLQQEVDALLEKRDEIEEVCDTLDKCEEGDGCETCDTYKKISDLDNEIEKLEDKIEVLEGGNEEEEEEEEEEEKKQVEEEDEEDEGEY